jgi:hypothetical protein
MKCCDSCPRALLQSVVAEVIRWLVTDRPRFCAWGKRGGVHVAPIMPIKA